jgi:hypothetical protein
MDLDKKVAAKKVRMLRWREPWELQKEIQRYCAFIACPNKTYSAYLLHVHFVCEYAISLFLD